MRVAIVSPYALDIPGGVQAQVLELAAQLRARGVDAFVVGPGAGGIEHAVDAGGSVGVRANGAVAPIAVAPAAWSTVRSALTEVDLVHVHEPAIPLVGWAGRVGEAPHVLTFHADPSALGRSVYRLAAPVLRRWVERAVAVTAVSPQAASAVASFAGDVEIVPNALDVAGYGVTAERHARRIAFLGRPDPRKGRDLLLEAFPAVRRRHPDAELVVMGGGEAPEVDGVRFAGRVSEDEKREILASSAVFCAPNRGGESFGITVAEGMAAGCAIVASDLPAFEHVLGGTGVLFSNGDAGALAGALAGLLDDSGERDRLAAASSERVWSFDWAAVVDRYLELYRRAVPAA